MELARSLPGVPVITGKDRRHSGKQACEMFNPSVIVLDDGMQYWQLHRDMELVVMNAERPFGSGMVMPAGDLREPKRGLNRAGAILLNGAAELSKDTRTNLINTLSELAPQIPVFACSKIPSGLVNTKTGESFGVDWIRGRKVVAFCGIGSPESFERMINDFGAKVLAFIAFRDHRKYTKQDIEKIITEKTSSEAELLITTHKDASRFKINEMPDDLFVLEIEMEVEETTRFEEHITNCINTAYKTTPTEETPDQTAG
jgi:tetraacyldisaccharide 4'-kinase